MDYKVKGESLTAIADAIRSKTGGADALTLAQMPTEIEGISGAKPTVETSVFAGSSPTPAQFVENVNLRVDTEVLVPLTYQVQSVEGATYGFALSSSGWWVSQNAGVASSFAMCKVLFNFEEETTVTLKCINYAQKGYDYGLISEVDTMLALDNTADSEGVLKSFVDSNSPSAVDVPVTIPAGEHFLCVKFRKDASTNSVYDTLEFVVTL